MKKNIKQEEIIESIRKAGFRNVFIHWETNKYDENNWVSYIDYIKEIGLNIIFAHLSYKGINSIWEEEKAGDELVQKYIDDISNCKKHNIPMVIMHLTSKWVAPMYNKLGLERLKK